MQKGKKSRARQVFWDSFVVMKKRTKEDPADVFNKALLNVTPLVEVRPRRVGGAVYQVPVEVTPQRQQSLSIRWLVNAARSRKGRMCDKLALEFLDAATNQGGAVKKKEDIQRMAHANKAFAHLAK